MSVLWIAIGAGIAAWVVAHVWSRYHAPGADPLGTVSEQWLADQRLNRPDSQRGSPRKITQLGHCRPSASRMNLDAAMIA